MSIWSFLKLFGKFYGHLAYFFLFGMLYQEKYGNPGEDAPALALKFKGHVCMIHCLAPRGSRIGKLLSTKKEENF
jgi:hypothetical protein